MARGTAGASAKAGATSVFTLEGEAQGLADRLPDLLLEALRVANAVAHGIHGRRRPGTGVGGETDRLIAWGPGPRASQALMLAVRAKALIDGRLAPSVDDVIALAEPVLKHRMALTFAARAEGETATSVINRLAAALE